jgi:hypothetical protein
MSKHFRPWNIDQTLLLPPNVRDFVPVKSRPTPTPRFAFKNDPSDGAETGGAEPQIAEQSRSWRAAIGEREIMRGS